MSQRRPKWKEAERYFLRHAYSIHSDGGDKVIVAPPDRDPQRRRQTVRLGHRFVKPGAELSHGHLKQIGRAFGVTAEDILRG